MPLPGQTSYAASKAGLEGFTRALSRDVAAKGVLVNAVAPGLIETEMLAEHAGGEAGALPEARSRSGGPARRATSPRWSRSWRPTPRHTSPGRSSASTAACSDEGQTSNMSQPPDELKSEIKQAIVRSLRLPITPEEIGDSTPLFGEGLGLDSIDVLELVLEIERVFGVAISDEETGARVLRSVDSIAEFITTEGRRDLCMTAAPRPGPAVERVHGRRRGVVPHLRRRRPLAPEHWERLPSRVVQTTRLVLDELDRAGVRATFFVLGWVADRHPALVARDRGGRPRHRLARTQSPARVRSRRRPLPRRCPPEPRDRCGTPGYPGVDRVPRAGVVDQRPDPVGARTAGARGVHPRRQHGAGAPGGQHRLASPPPRPGHPIGIDPRGSAARRRPVRAGDAARVGMGPALELPRSRARGRSSGATRPASRPC